LILSSIWRRLSNELHSNGYVIGDLNESNILVTSPTLEIRSDLGRSLLGKVTGRPLPDPVPLTRVSTRSHGGCLQNVLILVRIEAQFPLGKGAEARNKLVTGDLFACATPLLVDH
jgi:hypothetical protein